MRVLFIGGTGEISFACVEESVRAGHDVTIFNRGRTPDGAMCGVEKVVGDFADNAAYTALASRDFDVVCQFLVYSPDLIERDIELFSRRCRQYIFISSASAYQKPIRDPIIREDTPLGNPFWAYSRAKEACETRLLEASRKGVLPVTIVRPSHTYRRRLPSVVIHGDHLAWRLLNGKPVIVPGDGESVWTLTHAADFARAFVGLFGARDAIGECFHITDQVGHTWSAIVRTVAQVIGATADIRCALSKTLVRYRADWEGPLLGDKSNTMIFDTGKISRLVGGWKCDVPLEEGVARAWRFSAERLRNGYAPEASIDGLIDLIVQDHPA